MFFAGFFLFSNANPSSFFLLTYRDFSLVETGSERDGVRREQKAFIQQLNI